MRQIKLMKFEIRRYPELRWNADSEEHDLGAPGEVLMSLDAEYPAAAQTAALGSLGLHLRGMTYLTTTQAVAAWETPDGALALIVVDG
jgi:hypothetical protein